MKAASALLLAALLAAGRVIAQPVAPPDEVDLKTVLSLAREVSPRLAVEREGIAEAQADRIAAAALPNPVVSYGRFTHARGQRTVFEGSRQQEFAVELPLLLSGQRAARVARADLAVDAAHARVAAGASSLAAESGSAFVALLAAEEKLLLSVRARTEVEQLRGIVAGRAAGGFASRYELARVDLELGGLGARIEESRADVAERSGALSGLLAIPGWRPRASGNLQSTAGQVADAVRADDRVHPAVVAAQREEAAARQAVDVARRERHPVPAITWGRTWSSDPFGAAHFVGVSVELPILDDRRGPLARAQAEARAAALRREVAQAEARAQLATLEHVIEARGAALRRFDADAAQRLAPLRQMAEDAYRLGRGSILELIDATRSQLELEETRIDLEAALLEARVQRFVLGAAPTTAP